MNFDLTDEQRSLVDTARKFARNEIMPKAAHHDQTMEYPWDIVKKAHETGLLNISLPEDCGGLGLKMSEHLLVSEELAYGCTGIQTALGANDLAIGPLVIAANEAQKDEFLRPMAEEPTMAAYCVTEPGAGSDVQSLSTVATKDGDGYLLNGEKMWITNGGVAKWYYVLATMDPTAGHKAMVAFAIPADLEGVEPGKKEINLGQRCSDTRGIRFNNVRVPKKYMLGEEGDGFKIAMKAFDLSRPGTATAAVGLAQCAFDHAMRYSQERKTFNKPIFHHQAISFMLADMAKDIEAARLLTLKSGLEHDAGRRNTKWSSMAKCMAGDVAMKVATDAVQIFGGYGYNTEYPVEKLMRDAKIFQIYEGTQQIQRLIISKHLLAENPI
jgi:acyl-CoA dehydrogenase